MSAIWLSEIFRPIAVLAGIAAFLLILWSWRKNKDTGKTVGFCPETLRPVKIVFLCLPFAVLILLLVGYCINSDTFQERGIWKKWYTLAFGKYFLWGVFQQLLTHGFFTNRVAQSIKENWKTACVIGVLFAVIHLPNLVLAITTLFWGMASAYFFLAYSRNIYVLGFAHGILATTVKYFIALPLIGHGSMRVGPGFWN